MSEYQVLPFLQRKLDDAQQERSDEKLFFALKNEFISKSKYCDPSFGNVDVFEIVSSTDESIIKLQEMGKHDFLDPLSWNVHPPKNAVRIVSAILLLFGIPIPDDSSDGFIWNNLWTMWIVKNIDTHIEGWEWMASGEPVGLFTKPYSLSSLYLDKVLRLLSQIKDSQSNSKDPIFQQMTAYLRMYDYAVIVTKYVHMVTHCVDPLPCSSYVKEVTQPPLRTPKENVWFCGETTYGIKYYYNRLTQKCEISEPESYDGQRCKPSSTMKVLMEESMMCDSALRSKLEELRHEREKQLDDIEKEEWIECYDLILRKNFYYNFDQLKISFIPPKKFISAQESVAYRAVIKLQSIHKKRQAMRALQVKKVKRRNLPSFQSQTNSNMF